jgi:hypothetical protein
MEERNGKRESKYAYMYLLDITQSYIDHLNFYHITATGKEFSRASLNHHIHSP